jgi:Zn-dependent protease
MQVETFLYSASLWLLPVLLAITLHEAAHGFVAHRLGDDTAYRLGRVTLNPLKHIDLVGTIVMPAILLLLRAPFLFGYARWASISTSSRISSLRRRKSFFVRSCA